MADFHRSRVIADVESCACFRAIARTLHDKPADAVRWSTRSLAQTHGISRSVANIWVARVIETRLTQ